MPDLPVMLRIEGKRCVIVGGGPVARRRAAALLEAGGRVTVVSPQIDPDLFASGVPTFGICYGFQAMARALAVSGDTEGAAAWRQRAATALEAVAEPEDREVIARDLETIPA